MTDDIARIITGMIEKYDGKSVQHGVSVSKIEHMVIGIMATLGLTTVEDAAALAADPVPPTPDLEAPLNQPRSDIEAPSPVAAALIDNTNSAFAKAELLRLAEGRPIAAPKVNATAEFYAAYGSDSIMRSFERW